MCLVGVQARGVRVFGWCTSYGCTCVWLVYKLGVYRCLIGVQARGVRVFGLCTS